ncbi:FolC bifunctional protein [Thelephora ganbajun]|uniref:FolC bifunctional protein n=1 Tax=Thelephora ganbajun TaxID=370292 RepID=A0ACB6ZLC4_THEGA|nr:FolC bifunctional protein [Thelephora ganbajun]
MSIDLSLNRIRLLLSHLPTYKRPTCHIAGTNGKGSVSALLSSILQASSPPLSVGRFNSPHLLSIKDSIIVNSKPVATDVYDQVRGEVEELNQELGAQASKFEVLTSTAMVIFEKLKLDIVVMEVGMGGRLDATNAIPDDAVVVSALTSVDLDHQGFLGNTAAEIAREKVGIARRGKPFVLGRQRFPEVEEVVRDAILGNDIQGHLVRAAEPVEHPPKDPRGPTPVSMSLPCFPEPLRGKLPLLGSHQLSNLGIASTIVSELLTHPSCSHLKLSGRITPATFADGLAKTNWPGRLSFHLLPNRRSILVDGAHNRGSAQTLADFIAILLSSHPITGDSFNLTYVLGLSHSPPKKPLDTLAPLFSPSLLSRSYPDVKVNVAALEFGPPEDMPWVKAESPSTIYDAVKAHCPRARLWTPDDGKGGLSDALDWATDLSGGDGLVVLAGSLYLVADFYRFINLDCNGY